MARRPIVSAALIALVGLVLLAACGQKGPLTLPDESAAAPAAENAAEESTRDEEQDN